jgi:hypothetical protein
MESADSYKATAKPGIFHRAGFDDAPALGRMHEPTIAGIDRYMRNLVVIDAEEQQIAGLHLVLTDWPRRPQLLFSGARHADALGGMGKAHQAAAIEGVRPIATVSVGSAKLGQRTGRYQLTHGGYLRGAWTIGHRPRPTGAGDQEQHGKQARQRPHFSPTRRGVGRHAAHEGFGGVDLAAMDLEGFPCMQPTVVVAHQ